MLAVWTHTLLHSVLGTVSPEPYERAWACLLEDKRQWQRRWPIKVEILYFRPSALWLRSVTSNGDQLSPIQLSTAQIPTFILLAGAIHQEPWEPLHVNPGQAKSKNLGFSGCGSPQVLKWKILKNEVMQFSMRTRSRLAINNNKKCEFFRLTISWLSCKIILLQHLLDLLHYSHRSWGQC